MRLLLGAAWLLVLALSRQRLQPPRDHGTMGGEAHDGFQAFWEAGGPWPPLALSVIVGIVTLTVGLMLVYHGTSMSSSPLILCSVAGLLIGLALTVILPQARGALSLCFHGPQLPRTTQLPRTLTASTHPLTASTH